MTRRPLLLMLLLSVGGGVLRAAEKPSRSALDPGQSYRARKSEPVTYRVDFSAIVTAPYKTKILKVWMPIPPSDGAQEVTGSHFSTFPVAITPQIGTEKLHGNSFAYFEFANPQGAQIIRHRFTIKVWQLDWDVRGDRVDSIASWPESFQPYLRSEPLIPTTRRFRDLADSLVPARVNAAADLSKIMEWVQRTMTYSHENSSLQGSAIHALDRKTGHCSDYHGLCNALGRSLGYPTRIVYGINPYPKNSPSHCKLEAYLPPYGWVSFDVSETQQLMARIQESKTLSEKERQRLVTAAQTRLARGFRENSWYLQTRGSNYDLEPPATRKVAVVRTIYAEADGVPFPEPDPAAPGQMALSWMTAHAYEADRVVIRPFQDWKTLDIGEN